MDKTRYGKWGCWIAPVGVLLSLFGVIAAQPVDSRFVQKVTGTVVDPLYYEYRETNQFIPFISAIELRRLQPLQDSMYESMVRYPLDKFDGISATSPDLLITLARNYSVLQYNNSWDHAPINFQLVKASNSILFPTINADQCYTVDRPEQAAYRERKDIEALYVVKRRFDIKDWIFNPCYLIPWNGIGCGNSYGLKRISEKSLHDHQFTGPMPSFAHLLGKLRYLQNNSVNGTLEWLFDPVKLQERPFYHVNLTRLKIGEIGARNRRWEGPSDLQNNDLNVTVELQNNNRNGTVEWLCDLENPKENLNRTNTNFSGVIPGRLLNCSLKSNESGNMNKSDCAWKNKMKVVLGITLSGILIIALAWIMGMVVYQKIFCKKEEGGAIRRRGLETTTQLFFNRECSMVMVPNPEKCRSFTLDEMIAATQNFSREIGRGGFGSVFFGELPEGNVIAVKVLSSFSRQGIHEFLNEINLLSKINHRNLVSLLGYCNETKEVMLFYEHMSRGSLRDHLYGPSPENSGLNWKRRLKIALDAAQGLEYLHVGCIPKIIHRDIKTANILLDNNLNGKLGDFGLSRMTIDGEATHVTTAVKGTFGYLDPEYFNTQMLTDKSDVYGFGVVLLEIVCGRPPIDIKRPEEEINIVRWVTPYLLEMDENADKIIEILDKRLCGDYDMKSMIRVVKVAMRCVQTLPSSRPSVREVVTELREALSDEDKASISISEESRHLLASRADSTKRKGMEWNDNSSNIPNIGR